MDVHDRDRRFRSIPTSGVRDRTDRPAPSRTERAHRPPVRPAVSGEERIPPKTPLRGPPRPSARSRPRQQALGIWRGRQSCGIR